MTSGPRPKLALVLTGGGARAAYQVGVLRALARRFPDLEFPIITGVSAGAINASILAAHDGSFASAIERLATLWSTLTFDDVFHADAPRLAFSVVKWGVRLVSGGSKLAPPTRGMVDTAPLRRFLERALAAEGGVVPGIARNVERGRLLALGITTTNYATGQSVTWCQGKNPRLWLRPQRKAIAHDVSVDHVLASAALPLFFPAVEVNGEYHGDGGIRLAAPLAPALHLGADRILAISNRYERTLAEAERPEVHGYPPPAQVASVLLNAIFLDMIDFDAMYLARVNALVRALPPEQRGELKHCDLVVMRPSVDIGRLAGQLESELPRAFRFFSRGLGTKETSSPDSLAMLMFDPEFTKRLLEIGEKDGDARIDELTRFVTG